MIQVFSPIGFFHSTKKQAFDAARQAPFDQGSNNGFIELLPQKNFEQALQGLSGCTHIWVIYQFHLNSNWNPIVQPPRGPKQGVFATRSPHRPNPIGLSVLEIETVERLKIVVKAHDLLDGTPILDIKPYHPDVDIVPSARIAWVAELQGQQREVEFSPPATAQLSFLSEHGLPEFKNFLIQQLEFEPLERTKKRVFLWHEKAVIAYRTWRCLFQLHDQTVKIETIYSGYSDAELLDAADPHVDKELHREFSVLFPNRGDLPRFKS